MIAYMSTFWKKKHIFSHIFFINDAFISAIELPRIPASSLKPDGMHYTPKPVGSTKEYVISRTAGALRLRFCHP